MVAAIDAIKRKLANSLSDEVLQEIVNSRDSFNKGADIIDLQAVREAHGKTIDNDDDQWRKLTGDSHRDLSALTQERMQKLALYLWESNLLANRIIELPLAYLLAEGVSLQAADETVQEWIDRFWTDPINAMDLKLVKKCRELALFGEQCWPAFTNEHNGRVRLGYLDPALIATVVTDPDNGEQPIGVVTKKNAKGIARRYRVIVNGPEEELFTQHTQDIRESFTDGDAFYFNINSLSNGKRGRSDLLAQIDWLDAYDQFLFGELDRAGFMRAFIWDVTLKGASPEEVETRAKKIHPPAPASVRVHNDSEEWKTETPTLGSTDSSEAARLFRNHVTGGASIPEHWYGGGGDVNRATGDSMGEPTFKIFAMRQRHIGYMLEYVARYVVRQTELAHNRREPDLFDPIYNVEVVWPEMIARDTTKYAAALQQVVVAVSMAIDRGLLSEEKALQIIGAVSGRLGIDLDCATELEAARAQKAEQAETDIYSEDDDLDE